MATNESLPASSSFCLFADGHDRLLHFLLDNTILTLMPSLRNRHSIMPSLTVLYPITPSFPHFWKVERSTLLSLPTLVIFKICFSFRKIALLLATPRIFDTCVWYFAHAVNCSLLRAWARVGAITRVWARSRTPYGKAWIWPMTQITLLLCKHWAGSHLKQKGRKLKQKSCTNY